MRLFAIELRDADPELVSDRCWTAGAAGIWESDEATWRVGVEEDRVAGFLAAVEDLSPRDVTESDAVELATRLVVVDGIELSVPPTVFGDGDHPTTAGCLRALADAVRPGDRVVDVGCGSGVLSIAAARAGAAVTAVDIDAAAVAATLANAAANGVSLDASTTPLDAVSGPFDVVVANITAGSIEPLLADLVHLTARPGWLIVSGILEHQWPEVARRFRELSEGRAQSLTHAVEAGWVTGTLRIGTA